MDEPKVKFLIKKKNKKGVEDPIFLALYLRDEIELISTGYRVDKKDWNSKERCPKNESGDLAESLNGIKARISKAILRLKAREAIVTPFSVKEEFNIRKEDDLNNQIQKDKKDKENKKTIKSLANHWMDHNLFSYMPSTQKAVRESINQFIDFLTLSGNGSLERKELLPAVITAYEEYLQVKRKLSNSTHGKRMKHLRWFLRTLDYNVDKIKIRNHRKEIIALTLDELELLEKMDVSKSSEKQKAKDYFLIGCYTGLRVSDLVRINESCIIDGKISMMLKKNRRPVTIPVLPVTMEILKRYGMRSPKLSDAAFNRAIKEVCEDAKINTVITMRENKAGIDHDKKYKKYELITTHTASKTFITTVGPKRYGLSPEEIAAIVGKDLKTLLNHYFKLPLDTAIKKMTAV